MEDGVVIRPYRDEDEQGWVRCRVLSFLDSAYFDDVRREKERYEHPALELVAERDGEIVGLIDVECEYESRGFERVHSYLNVYIELHEGLRASFPITADGLRPIKMFAHYVGDDREEMRRRFSRVHENVLYELRFAS